MPVIIPLIIPVEDKVACIVQDGKQYCEKQDLTKQEVVGACIGIPLFIVWIIAILYLATTDRAIYSGLVFLLPFILGILLCILL